MNSKQLCAAVRHIIAGPSATRDSFSLSFIIFAPSPLYSSWLLYVYVDIYLYIIACLVCATLQRHHISCQPGPVGSYCYISSPPCTRPRNTHKNKKLGGLFFFFFFLAEPSSLIVEPKFFPFFFFFLGLDHSVGRVKAKVVNREKESLVSTPQEDDSLCG